MTARLSRCDPNLLDFVSWAVLKGCRLFQRVHITAFGLIATTAIPAFDFVAIVPTSATLSVISLADDQSFPLKVSPQNHAERLAFWPDLTLGSFALVGYFARALRTGNPRGVRSYLDILPFVPDTKVDSFVDTAQKSTGYKELVRPIKAICKELHDSEFDLAFRHAYCLFRRHSVPFWSCNKDGGCGHPDFQHSAFVEGGDGDIVGMLPVLDLAVHSPEPNAVIGYPDSDMLRCLVQEKKTAGIQLNRGYFVLQAQREIGVGEVITVNKNAHFDFDDATFEAWFGYPNVSQVSQSFGSLGACTTASNHALEFDVQEINEMQQ